MEVAHAEKKKGQTAAESTPPGTHILAIPYPMMGHMTPVVQICRLLIARVQGCKVTMVVLERDLPSLRTLLDPPPHHLHPHSNIHVLPLSDGLPLDVISPPHWDTSRSLLVSYHSPHLGFARSFAQHIPHLHDVACIISDVYLSWTQDVANRLGVPRIAVWVAGVCEFQVYTHAQELLNSKKLPFQAPKGQQLGIDNMMPERSGRPPAYHRVDELYEGDMLDIPGLPPLSRGDFPVFLQIEDPTDIYFYNWVENIKNSHEASMVLFNTFDALEGNLIKLLNSQGIPAHPVGPLFLLEGVVRKMEDAKIENERQDGESVLTEEYKKIPNACLEWLDNQKPRSVLYVAFGSAINLTKTQVNELALGLQSSRQPFIWAHRQYRKGEEEEGFPKSFLDYIMKERRGLLVQWAPQKRILEHDAIGGFLSHCGWNSTMEAICCGVPIIGFPFVSDQSLHCKMLVDVWKVAVRLRRDPGSGIAIASEIAKLTQQVLVSEKGERLRGRAQELMVGAQRSVQVGGSSYSNS